MTGWPATSARPRASSITTISATPLMHGSQPVTLITLNLNHAVLDSPTCDTPILELCGEFEQTGFIERHIGQGRHTLSSPSLGYPTQANHGGDLLGHFLLRNEMLDDSVGRRRYPLPSS